jgi:hypothetical protein
MKRHCFSVGGNERLTESDRHTERGRGREMRAYQGPQAMSLACISRPYLLQLCRLFFEGFELLLERQLDEDGFGETVADARWS